MFLALPKVLLSLISLPVSVSHWWDILCGPVWSILVYLAIDMHEKKLVSQLIFGLIFGLALTLVFEFTAIIVAIAMMVISFCVAAVITSVVGGLITFLLSRLITSWLIPKTKEEETT